MCPDFYNLNFYSNEIDAKHGDTCFFLFKSLQQIKTHLELENLQKITGMVESCET